MELDTAEPVVLQTLSHACSQDAAVLKPAEQQLKDWETQPGFYSILSVRVVVNRLYVDFTGVVSTESVMGDFE